jgi:hypothetical protein
VSLRRHIHRPEIHRRIGRFRTPPSSSLLGKSLDGGNASASWRTPSTCAMLTPRPFTRYLPDLSLAIIASGLSLVFSLFVPRYKVHLGTTKQLFRSCDTSRRPVRGFWSARLCFSIYEIVAHATDLPNKGLRRTTHSECGKLDQIQIRIIERPAHMRLPFDGRPRLLCFAFIRQSSAPYESGRPLISSLIPRPSTHLVSRSICVSIQRRSTRSLRPYLIFHPH